MRLSICIPTYNFGKFIGGTLDTIIPQLTADVEVVILDGGSTDNTAEVVEGYCVRSSNIRYYRQEKRGGIDSDIHLAVQKARGAYCWLFSADDWMREGALAKILRETEENHDVYICGFTICSLDMKSVIEEHHFSMLQEETSFNLANKSEREAYFSSAVATPAFFSFMSSLIIKRERWLETDLSSDFFGSCWAHAARIFHMIPIGLGVKYLPTSLLRKRAFNDSFMDKGYIHRVSIAIDGYQDMAARIFGAGSFEAFHIRRTLRNEFTFNTFLDAKQHVKHAQDANEFYRLLRKSFVDSPIKKWIYQALIFITPLAAIPFLKKVNRFRKMVVAGLAR